MNWQIQNLFEHLSVSCLGYEVSLKILCSLTLQLKFVNVLLLDQIIHNTQNQYTSGS